MYANEYEQDLDRVSEETGVGWNDRSKVAVLCRVLKKTVEFDEFTRLVEQAALDEIADSLPEDTTDEDE